MKLPTKKAADKTLIVKPEEPKLRPTLDYPMQDEKIAAHHYSIRVTVDEAANQVDVSLDQGPWQQCRKSHGHWWLDVSDFGLGEHEVIARARKDEGRWMVSIPNEFEAV